MDRIDGIKYSGVKKKSSQNPLQLHKYELTYHDHSTILSYELSANPEKCRLLLKFMHKQMPICMHSVNCLK